MKFREFLKKLSIIICALKKRKTEESEVTRVSNIILLHSLLMFSFQDRLNI